VANKTVVLALISLMLGSSPGWAYKTAIGEVYDRLPETTYNRYGRNVFRDLANSPHYPVKLGGMFLRSFYRVAEASIEVPWHAADGIFHPRMYGLSILTGPLAGAYYALEKGVLGFLDFFPLSLLPGNHGLTPDHGHASWTESKYSIPPIRYSEDDI